MGLGDWATWFVSRTRERKRNVKGTKKKRVHSVVCLDVGVRVVVEDRPVGGS